MRIKTAGSLLLFFLQTVTADASPPHSAEEEMFYITAIQQYATPAKPSFEVASIKPNEHW